MKQAILTTCILFGVFILSHAEGKLATFKSDSVEYELYNDKLIIHKIDKTEAILIDEVNILVDNYQVFFSDPAQKLTFMKSKTDTYTLIGKLKGKKILIKNLLKSR